MSPRILRSAGSVAALLVLSASIATAWTPSDEPPRVDGEPALPAPAQGPYPDIYGPPPDMYMGGYPAYAPGYPTGPNTAAYPPMEPGYPPYYGQPGGYSGGPAAGDQGGAGPLTFAFAGMEVTQDRSDEAYTLDIALNGVDPSLIRITPMPMGRGLMIVSEQSTQTSREETYNDGRGFSRSYSYSSGRNVKRLPVPPDAELSAMRREDADGRILVSIPRLSQSSQQQPEQP